MLEFRQSKIYQKSPTLIVNILLANCAFQLVKGFRVSNSTCTATSYAGVAKPEDCRGGTDFIPSASRLYLMTDTRHTVHCCGQIIGWRFQASVRAMIRPIDFTVWRPRTPGISPTLELIDRFEYWYMKDVSRTVEVDLEEEDYIDVEVGDVIGWHTPLGDVVDYRTISDETTYIIVNGLSVDDIGQGQEVNFSELSHFARGYGFQAILKPAQAPIFMEASHRLTFKCPLTRGAFLTSVRVLDDQKKNTPVTFHIEGYNPWFQIETSTGVITTKSAVHGNLTNELVVTAQTSKCAVSYVVLTLQCIEIKLGEKESHSKDISTPPSQLSQQRLEETIHIPFLESRFGEVTIFSANNVTQNNVERERLNQCEISDVQPQIGPGILYTSGPYLLIKTSSQTNQTIATSPMHVNLTCFEPNWIPHTFHLVVHVVKDKEPEIHNLPDLVYVSTKRNLGDTVFVVNASDQETRQLKFDFMCACPFALGADGNVTVNGNLRSLTRLSYQADVFVEDTQHRVGPFLLHIIITEPNHSPHFNNLPSQILVPEGSKGRVIQFEVMDTDEDDPITLSWAWRSPLAVNYFTLCESSMELNVSERNPPDYETVRRRLNDNTPTFDLLLTLSDGALTSETHVLKVIVTDVNERPVFTSRTIALTCLEGKTGSVIDSSTVRELAFDEDFNESLRFHLLPTAGSENFLCNRTTGEITFARDYDVDQVRLPPNVFLRVVVNDHAGLKDVLNISLTVKNVNVAPVISVPTFVRVPEDVPGGSLLFTAFASDWDSLDTIDLSIFCEDDQEDLFNIDIQGRVYLRQNKSLDFETVNKFRCLVQANDATAFSYPVHVTVNISNINEAPFVLKEQLNLQSYATRRGDLISTTNFQTLFIDPEGDPVRFKYDILIKDTELMFDMEFQAGHLILASDFKLQKSASPSTLHIIIIGEDPSGLRGEMKLKLEMLYTNSEPSLLNLPMELLILEHQYSKGDVVFAVEFVDEDEADHLVFSYNIKGQPDIEGIFSLNTSNGEVTQEFVPILAMGETIFNSIEIIASDHLSFSSPGVLNITVAGINDPPRFISNEITFVINETQIGHPVLDVNSYVFDPDPADTLHFSIVSGEGYLVIANATTCFTITSGYDIDEPGTSSNLTAHLMVRDKGGLIDTTTIMLVIKDVNDNEPKIFNDKATFSLSHPVSYEQRFGQVLANDSDSGLNGLLSFELVGSTLNDTTHYFSITDDGWLFSTGLAPPEDFVTIYVAVHDNGRPAHFAMASIHVVLVQHSNETTSLRLRSYESRGKISEERDEGNKSAVFGLIVLTTLFFAVSLVLGYQLWKTRKQLRSAQADSHHNEYHEYRFPWVTNRIMDEDLQNSPECELSPMASSPSAVGSCVYNPHFSFHPVHLQLQHQSDDNGNSSCSNGCRGERENTHNSKPNPQSNSNNQRGQSYELDFSNNGIHNVTRTINDETQHENVSDDVYDFGRIPGQINSSADDEKSTPF